MMNDRELLELAAKAAGITERELKGYYMEGMDTAPWNPLTDDGDALRLAVKLNMDVASDEFNGDTLVLCSGGVGHAFKPITEPHNGDPYAATRRAIVRAAAEIGKGMK